MAEEKNNFIGGRMNKDLDERLMRNGEYRDARNVAVSNSDSGKSGSLENVIGNKELTDFGITSSHCEIIGQFADVENNRIFVFITNYNDSSADGLSNFAYAASEHYIFMYDLDSSSYIKLVQGNFLNFSKTNKIIQVNLIEDLLFWTDDRNQPRKINVKTAIDNSSNIENNPYYNKEEHISVAKYYPWNSIRVYETNNYGAIADDNYSLFSAITSNSLSGVADGPYTYTVAGTNGSAVSTTTGSGVDGEVDLTITGGLVSAIVVRDGGSGFAVGDDIVFIDPTASTTDSVTVTLRAQDFKVETTMKDTISKLLPFSGNGTSTAGVTASTNVTLTSPSADLTKFVGCLIYVEDSSGNEQVSISEGYTVVSVTPNASDYDIVLSANITTPANAVYYLGANPYYDEDTAPRNANIEDKFVRFSYRFKYDDNEYSLIAPFSQSIFIPKQDGHFLGTGTGSDIDTDEVDAYKSSDVRFFENKVTNAKLIIDLPEGVSEAKDLFDEYKVKEVEILMKDSVDASFKLIDTIYKEDLSNSTEDIISYDYNSTEPTNVLPEREVTRVFDKVPVRAKSQESVGNRIVYGNFIPELPYEDELDFSVSSGVKGFQGEYEDAFSRIEYPSHTLKQNRTYQVGIVLSDKFGRQSDVITSDSSTIKHEFRDSEIALMDANDIFMGDSLKVTFNEPIPNQSLIAGYRGVYDETTNPLGWYSYKVVVKQQEQSYYNCYVPSILNGYPVDATSASRVRDLAHITLIGDNVNKIPRNFTESNENDDTFSSNVKIYPRVSSSIYVANEHSTEQYATPSTPLKVTEIGNRDDLGLNETEDGVAISVPSTAVTGYDESTFYTIPSIIRLGSNPLIARVSTNNELGTVGGNTGDAGYISFEKTRLEIVETEPVKSNLDIYWETSTSGLISELNASVEAASDFDGIPFTTDDIGWRLAEDTPNNTKITNDFTVKDVNGTDILTAGISGQLLSVISKNGEDWTNYFDLNKEVSNKFSIDWVGGTQKDLVYTQFSQVTDNLDIKIKFTNTVGGVDKVQDLFFQNNILTNKFPVLDEHTTDLGLKDQSLRSDSSNTSVITGWKKAGVLTFENGSIYSPSVEVLYEVSKVEYYNTNSASWETYTIDPNANVTNNNGTPIATDDTTQMVRVLNYNNEIALWYSPWLQSVKIDNAPASIWSGLSGTVVFGRFYYGINDSASFSQVSNDADEGITETQPASKLRSGRVFRYISGALETDFRVYFNVFDANGGGLVNEQYVEFSMNTQVNYT